MFGRRMFFTFTYATLFFFVCAALFFMYVYWLGPPPLEENIGATIVDRNGEIIYDDDLDIIPLEEMPDYLIDAFILTEDKHFYHHFGFDLRGIARALIRNIEAKQLKEGASTITQQLARNLYLTHEKTWMRKLKESFYTVRLEMFYPKDTILTMYLNTIYFGHGAYGIGDASELFFGKDVNELSVAEATMLAGIPKGPTYYSPFNDLENATERQQIILDRLLVYSKITEAEYYAAKSEQLQFSEKKEEQGESVGYFIDFVWKEIEETLNMNKEKLLNDNVTIHTTLDKNLQQQLEKALERETLKNSDIEIGVVSIEPKTGAIRQMVGGKNYEKARSTGRCKQNGWSARRSNRFLLRGVGKWLYRDDDAGKRTDIVHHRKQRL